MARTLIRHFVNPPIRPLLGRTVRHGKRIVVLALVALALLPAAPSLAGSWMFRRSYYSHLPATPVVIGLRASGGPYYSRPQGAWVTGGYRHLRSNISINGRVYDDLHVYESWVQGGEQF